MAGVPSEEVLGCGTADAALAWAHPATGMQFGFAPGVHWRERPMANILAPAYECLRGSKLVEFRPEGECTVELSRETKVLRTRSEEMRG